MGATESWDENTDLLPRVALQRRSTRLMVIGACVAASVAAGTFVVPATPHNDPRAADVVKAQAAALATALDTTARTAHERSDQIASISVLRAAILTDARTVADLVASKEFTLQPLAGETMELFQIDGGQVASLVRTPPAAKPIRWMRGAGTRLENVGDGMDVVVTADVERLKDGAGYKSTISGSFALSDPIDLAGVRAQLRSVAVSAVIEGAGGAALIVLAPVAGEVGGTPLRATIHPNPEWFGDLTLVVTPRIHAERPAWVTPVRIASAALGLLLLAGTLVRRRPSTSRR